MNIRRHITKSGWRIEIFNGDKWEAIPEVTGNNFSDRMDVVDSGEIKPIF